MIVNMVVPGSDGSTPVLYNITNNVSSFVSSDKSTAEEGETVTATWTSNPSRLCFVFVKQNSDNTDIKELFEYGKKKPSIGDTATFTMPADDVTIYAT